MEKYFDRDEISGDDGRPPSLRVTCKVCGCHWEHAAEAAKFSSPLPEDTDESLHTPSCPLPELARLHEWAQLFKGSRDAQGEAVEKLSKSLQDEVEARLRREELLLRALNLLTFAEAKALALTTSWRANVEGFREEVLEEMKR